MQRSAQQTDLIPSSNVGAMLEPSALCHHSQTPSAHGASTVSKRHRRFYVSTYFLTVAFLSFLSGFLFAQQPTPLEPKKGAIEGSVIDAKSGEPLRDTEMRLTWESPTPVVVDRKRPSPDTWKTRTDQRGKYEFRNLEPGGYFLRAEKSGYGAEERTVYGAKIPLAAGELATGATIELTRQGSISGRVVDDEGKPVHTGVAFLQEKYINGRKQWYPMPGMAGQTNERGEFQVAGVWTGPVILHFTPWRFYLPTASGVTDAAPDMAYVGTYYPGTTDVSRASWIEVSPGAQRSGLESRILKGRVSKIGGSVRDHTGQLAKNCGVTLIPTDPAWSMLVMAHATDAPDGRFEFQHVHPGSYRLIIDLAQGLVHRELITLGSTNVDNLDVQLPPPIQIEGEIRIKGDVKVDPRTVFVSLHLDEEGGRDLRGPQQTTTDGTKFVFDKVLPGTYRITASVDLDPTSQNKSVYVEPIQYGVQEVTDAPIEITARPSPIRVTVNSGAGSVTGIVMKNKAPARRAIVLLLSADKARRLDQRWPQTMSVDYNARFTIDPIPPGDYLAFAFEKIEKGFWRDEVRFQKFASSAKKISIERNGSTSVNLEVSPLPD